MSHLHHLFLGMQILIFCTYPVLVLLTYNHPEVCILKSSQSLSHYYLSSISHSPSHCVLTSSSVSRFVLVTFRMLSYCIARILIRSIVEHTEHIISFIGYLLQLHCHCKVYFVFDSHKKLYIFRFITREMYALNSEFYLSSVQTPFTGHHY